MTALASLSPADARALDEIVAIMDAAFDKRWNEGWTRAQIAGSLVLPRTHTLFIEPDGRLGEQPAAGEAAGFVLSAAAPGEEELLLIAVRPADRGAGLGTGLLAGFLERAQRRGAERAFLEMRCNNPARTLYERAGFSAIGRRRDYYRLDDGGRLDAITFARSLT